MSVLERLVSGRRFDELQLIFRYLNDVDLLHVSQTCVAAREVFMERNMFNIIQKSLVTKAKKVITLAELDEEREFLEEQCGPVDNIKFHFYVKKRLNGVIEKGRLFKHKLRHAYLGDHALDKWKPVTENVKGENLYRGRKPIAIHGDTVAFGHIDGKITVMNLATEKVFDFTAYQVESDRQVFWTIVVNEQFIVTDGGINGRYAPESWYPIKIFDHQGNWLNEFYPLQTGVPCFSETNKLVVMHPKEDFHEKEIHVYDLASIDRNICTTTQIKTDLSIAVDYDGIFWAFEILANDKVAIVLVQEAEEMPFSSLEWAVHTKRVDYIWIYSLDTGFHIDMVGFERHNKPYMYSFIQPRGMRSFNLFKNNGQTYLSGLIGESLMVWKIDDGNAFSLCDFGDLAELPKQRTTKSVSWWKLGVVSNMLMSINDDICVIAVHSTTTLIYVVPTSVLVASQASEKRSEVTTRLQFENGLLNCIQPICMVEEIDVTGLVITRRGFLALYANGSISEFDFKDLSDEQKLELYSTSTSPAKPTLLNKLPVSYRHVKRLLQYSMDSDLLSINRTPKCLSFGNEFDIDLLSLRFNEFKTADNFKNKLIVVITFLTVFGNEFVHLKHDGQNVEYEEPDKPMLHRFIQSYEKSYKWENLEEWNDVVNSFDHFETLRRLKTLAKSDIQLIKKLKSELKKGEDKKMRQNLLPIFDSFLLIWKVLKHRPMTKEFLPFLAEMYDPDLFRSETKADKKRKHPYVKGQKTITNYFKKMKL